jgi:capsular exopolysaccharide synthesis family protein
MDNTIKTKEEVESLTGLSVIGIIPKLFRDHLKPLEMKKLPPSGEEATGTAIARSERRRRRKYQQQIEELVRRKLTNLDPRSPIVESYRSIRSNIRYASTNGDLKSLLITSSVPGEGKSLTISNLAITFAKSGTKSVLVDCDLHRPRLHHMFGVDKSPGISELLTDQIEGNSMEEKIERALVKTEVDNLYILPSGKLPPNPGDLLASENTAKIISFLRSEFEFVLIDAPPLGPVSDISALADKVDSTVLLIRAGRTKKPIISHSKDKLDALEVKVVGAIMNEIDPRNRRYSDYYYNYSKYSKGYYASDSQMEEEA